MVFKYVITSFTLHCFENYFSLVVIGRAIRHINDYAAILLVDARYANSSDCLKRSFPHPTNKLPQWIRDRFVSSTCNYGEVHRMLHQFFKLNNKRGTQQKEFEEVGDIENRKHKYLHSVDCIYIETLCIVFIQEFILFQWVMQLLRSSRYTKKK